MKYIFLSIPLFLSLSVFTGSNHHSETDLEKASVEFEIKLVKGIDAYYQTDWVAARDIFSELKKIYPDDPRPYFFESMMPFLEYFFVDQSPELADNFLNISEKAVDLSQRKLNSHPNDTTMVLMLSGLHGYRGLVAAGQNRHRVALSSGLTGFNYTRKLLSMDSDRPDARIGRGMFYYMVGNIPSGMRWASNMVGLRADIEDGFYELKQAANSESYIRNDAKMMLMYLYDKEGRYEEALEYALLLTEGLPENVIFLYKKAEIYEKLNNNHYAADVYRLIIGKNNNCLQSITKKSFERLKEIEKITSNR